MNYKCVIEWNQGNVLAKGWCAVPQCWQEKMRIYTSVQTNYDDLEQCRAEDEVHHIGMINSYPMTSSWYLYLIIPMQIAQHWWQNAPSIQRISTPLHEGEVKHAWYAATDTYDLILNEAERDVSGAPYTIKHAALSAQPNHPAQFLMSGIKSMPRNAWVLEYTASCW